MSGSSAHLPAAILILPAMSTNNSALIAMLNSLASNVQQALGPFIAILIHMEV